MNISEFGLRYMKVWPVTWGAPRWCLQTSYEKKFAYQHRDLHLADLQEMWQHEHWIACRARPDGITEWIGIDVDCKPGADVAVRNRIYWALRDLLGRQRIPLVYRTPSGRGLHVWYRIPATPLGELITGAETGLLADVLRGAGIDPERGTAEIYPQHTQAIRLPLGRRMPIIDPDTLAPLPHAAIGDTFDEAMLWGGLAEIEAAHQRVHTDLIPHLRSLDRIPRLIPGHSGGGVGSAESRPFVSDGNGGSRPSDQLQALIERGLTQPSSRYDSEWQVGLAMVRFPNLFARYGIARLHTEMIVAGALARWLSEHHNGHSEEWDGSVRRHGSAAGAIDHWTRRYLTRNAATGETLIDRLEAVVARMDPLSLRVRQVSAIERRRILQMGERYFPAGARRYYFETWLSAFLRAIRDICHHHAGQGANPVDAVDANGRIVVEIAADWMEEWPYGDGRYREYCDLLLRAGGLDVVQGFVPPALAAARGSERGVARRYRVRAPDARVTVRDLGIAPWELITVLGDLFAQDPTRYGRFNRPISVDEAYHALHLADSALRLKQRYKRDTMRHVSRLAEAIRVRAAEREASGESQWQHEEAA